MVRSRRGKLAKGGVWWSLSKGCGTSARDRGSTLWVRSQSLDRPLGLGFEVAWLTELIASKFDLSFDFSCVSILISAILTEPELLARPPPRVGIQRP